MGNYKCPICGKATNNAIYVANYPHFLCNTCCIEIKKEENREYLEEMEVKGKARRLYMRKKTFTED